MALAFWAGCAAGYAFSARTLLKLARERIDGLVADAKLEREKCEDELEAMRAELQELRDILMGKKPLPPFHVQPRDTLMNAPKDTPADMKALLGRIDQARRIRDDEE